MRIIDISVPVDGKTVVWPGNARPKLQRLSDMHRGKKHNETALSMNAHTGTHLDAPLHFIETGKSIDAIPLSIFVGNAYVADLRGVKDITASVLEGLSLPKGTTRLLFKTSNSKLWGKSTNFKKGYVGITSDAAQWLVKKKIKLVGIDYLSVAKFDDAVEVHNILLGKGLVVLEGTDLSKVRAGEYELFCAPIKLKGAEGAPARAFLIER